MVAKAGIRAVRGTLLLQNTNSETFYGSRLAFMWVQKSLSLIF
jgi:hypothetical protein